MDKYDVAGQRIDGKVVAQLPLGELGKIAKAILYFLKADKKHSCKINALGKAISAGDGLEMKVLCRLLLFTKKKI